MLSPTHVLQDRLRMEVITHTEVGGNSRDAIVTMER